MAIARVTWQSSNFWIADPELLCTQITEDGSFEQYLRRQWLIPWILPLHLTNLTGWSTGMMSSLSGMMLSLFYGMMSSLSGMMLSLSLWNDGIIIWNDGIITLYDVINIKRLNNMTAVHSIPDSIIQSFMHAIIQWSIIWSFNYTAFEYSIIGSFYYSIIRLLVVQSIDRLSTRSLDHSIIRSFGGWFLPIITDCGRMRDWL